MSNGADACAVARTGRRRSRCADICAGTMRMPRSRTLIDLQTMTTSLPQALVDRFDEIVRGQAPDVRRTSVRTARGTGRFDPLERHPALYAGDDVLDGDDHVPHQMVSILS